MKWDLEGVVINKKLFPCGPGTSKHTVTGSIVDFETNIEADIDTMEVTIPYDADNSFSSLTVEHTGANIWGGLTMAQTFEGVIGYTLDTINKTFSFQRSSPMKPVFAIPFKTGTQYSILLTFTSEGNNSCLRFRYTDGTTSDILIPSSNEKTTVIVASSSSKNLQDVAIGYKTANTVTVYYDESGLFEGVLTTDDFAPYSPDPHTLDLGSTVYGGTFDILGGTGKAYDSEGVLQDITFTPVESIVTFNGINNIWCDVDGSTNKVIYLTEKGITCDTAKQFLPLFYNKERRIL